jgi:outer membrane protein TolC
VVLRAAPARSESPLPAPPAVDDPQLAPPPAAPRTLKSWDEALSLIRAQSPDYLATYDNVLRAEAQTRVALAGILPGVAAQVSFTHQFVTQNTNLGGPETPYPIPNVWGVGAGLNWPIGDPHAWYVRGTAEQNVAAAKSDLADKRRTIAQSIVTTMIGTLAAERVVMLNRTGLRAALERLTLTETKARLGSGTPLDVERARQDVAAARAMVITGDESLRQSREALGLALGSREAIAAPGDLTLADFEKTVTGTCRLNDDIEERADVVAARTRVTVAERASTELWLGSAPSFNLQSQFLWNNQVLYGPTSNWDVLAVLNIPIFDGGVLFGRLREAQATLDQSRQALAAVRLNAMLNATQSARAVVVAKASRDVAQTQRDLAASIDLRTREGYQHGIGTSLDLVTSAQALRQAEISLALLDFQVSQARVLAGLAHADCAF